MAATMTQTQLIASIAESCDMPTKTARLLLTTLRDVAVTEVKKNGLFILPGIGRLVRVDRKARMGRNPGTGESIKIAAKKVVKSAISSAVVGIDRAFCQS